MNFDTHMFYDDWKWDDRDEDLLVYWHDELIDEFPDSSRERRVHAKLLYSTIIDQQIVQL